MFEFLHLRKPKLYLVRVQCPLCRREGGLHTPDGFLRERDVGGALKHTERLVTFQICSSCQVKQLGFKLRIPVSRCLDCGLVIDAEGSAPFESELEPQVRAAAQTETSFTICERCAAKRSGFFGAQANHELGLG